MLKMRTFLDITSTALVVLGLVNFVLNNVADAIFLLVVALLIRQGIDKYD